MIVVNLYVENDFPIPVMDQAVADAALNVAENLLKNSVRDD